jgi:presenilin-like A22 family membrane protease
MEEKFRATAIHLVPEVATLIMAGILATAVLESKMEVEAITAFPETPTGATLNMTMFVAIMAVIATVMYLLVKHGLERIFRLILKIAIVAVLFALVNWYAEAFLAILRAPIDLAAGATFASSLVLTAALAYAINFTRGVTQVVAITFLGAMLGTFLGASIPTLTTIILLLGLVCYDILAVFKGPIGKIAEKTELENLSGATLTFGDLTVGLGDLVFYSMLASHALFTFGLISYVAASIGVIIGTFLGFKMLEKRSTFPGLPLSLICGLGILALTILLQHGLSP